MPSDPSHKQDGEAQGAFSLAEMPSVSPVDGAVVGWFPVTHPDAVPALRDDLFLHSEWWAALPLRERLARLAPLRRHLAARADELARLLAREVGKPLVEGYGGEVLPTLRYLEWLERNACRALRPVSLSRFPRRVQEWQPHGVVGLITPWNYPMFLSLPQIAQALAAGNTVLWKPSELALAVSSLLMEIMEAAGLADLVRMAGGDASVGRAVADAACDQYVFIGGAETGRGVLERLGRALRPAVAELSGTDPLLVLEDAPLPLAARAAVWGRMLGAGQTCMSPKRVYVHHSRYELFLAEARQCLEALRLGDPALPEIEVGPLRTEALREAARRAITDAVRQGARLLRGGYALPGPGWYLEPTLLADCSETMSVFREDLFAPVLAVASFEDLEEAVFRANGSPFALTAGVWTGSPRRGQDVARRLRGGVVMVNDVLLPAAAPGVPFGGSGDSGYGRVRGLEGLRAMARPRVLDGGPPLWLPRMHHFPYRPGTVDLLRAGVRSAGSGWWRASGGLWKALRGYGKGPEE